MTVDPVLLTFDLDWAPDFAIDAVAGLLIERRIRATWLITHASAAVDRLREHSDLFELGIHPNFRSGSTHGTAIDGVLEHCLEIVPHAVSMRTHSLAQSTPLLARVVATTPIRVDASLLLPRVPGLRPFVQPYDGNVLVRVPFDWEDDVEMEFAAPRWDAQAVLREPGMRTFNFHPMLVYLNAREMTPYRTVRSSVPKLDALEEAAARPYVNEGIGVGTTLRQLVDAVDPARMKWLKELR